MIVLGAPAGTVSASGVSPNRHSGAGAPRAGARSGLDHGAHHFMPWHPGIDRPRTRPESGHGITVAHSAGLHLDEHLPVGGLGDLERRVIRTIGDPDLRFREDPVRMLRAIALANTELARATAATIRVKLLKTGAAVIRNTLRVRILFASHHPMRDTFLTAAQALAP